MFNERKNEIAVIVLIAIICIASIILASQKGIIKNPMLLTAIGRNRIGEGTEQEGSGAFSLSSNDKVGQTVDMSKWDMDRVNAVVDTDGVYVPVPKGFVASEATGEHTVNTGFVIYEGEGEINDDNAWQESCTRNQFVWVPVADPTRVYEEIGTTGKKKAKLRQFNSSGDSEIVNRDVDTKREPGILSDERYDNKRTFARYGMQGYTREKLYQELSTSFDRDMESIEKYGGFYIGRYETGNITSEQPVVQRMNDNNGVQSWYTIYPRIKNISTNENIETGMIWGCLWDETIQWFIDTESKSRAEVTSDSRSWGNYSGTTFEYTNTSGGISTKSSSIIIPTGSTERNKANNIYDMAGNNEEWTMEGGYDGSGRCYRGGSINGMDITVKSRYNYGYPTVSCANVRSHLYIR